MTDFTITESLDYYQYSPLDIGLGATEIPDNGYTEPMTATITLSPIVGSFRTGLYTTANSTWADSTGQWKIVGTRAELNAALYALRYLPSPAGLITDTVGTIEIYEDGNATAVGDGTISLDGTTIFVIGPNVPTIADAVTTPLLLTNPGTTSVIDLGQAGDPDSTLLRATVTLKDYDDVTITDGSAGSFDTGIYGRAISSFASGVWTIYGTITEVNLALANTLYTSPAAPDVGFGYQIVVEYSDEVTTPVEQIIRVTMPALGDAEIMEFVEQEGEVAVSETDNPPQIMEFVEQPAYVALHTQGAPESMEFDEQAGYNAIGILGDPETMEFVEQGGLAGLFVAGSPESIEFVEQEALVMPIEGDPETMEFVEQPAVVGPYNMIMLGASTWWLPLNNVVTDPWSDVGYDPTLDSPGGVMGYDGSIWVYVVNDKIYSSDDQFNWTLELDLSSDYKHFQDVKHDGSIWVAVGYGTQTSSPFNVNESITYSSTDGSTWTARTGNLGSTSYARSVTTDGTTWAQVGFIEASSDDARVSTSTDGITWTLQSTTVPVRAASRIETNGTDWVISGGGNAESTLKIASTTDPTSSWTARTIGVGSRYVSDLSTDGTIIVAVGQNGIDGKIFSSTDGTTWTLRQTVSSEEVRIVDYDGTTWIAITTGGKIYSSTDGTTWTYEEDLGSPTPRSIASILTYPR